MMCFYHTLFYPLKCLVNVCIRAPLEVLFGSSKPHLPCFSWHYFNQLCVRSDLWLTFHSAASQCFTSCLLRASHSHLRLLCWHQNTGYNQTWLVHVQELTPLEANLWLAGARAGHKLFSLSYLGQIVLRLLIGRQFHAFSHGWLNFYLL